MKNILATKIYSKKTIERVRTKIVLLGNDCKLDIITFLNLRLFISLAVFVIFFIFNKFGIILAPILALIIYNLFNYLLLDYPIKRRSKQLENEALFFFNILMLTLESGRTLREALILTTNNVDSMISIEFKKMLEETRLGKSLNEAIDTMRKRIPSDTINNTILNMIEANTFGTSMVDSLNNQINYLREKRVLDVKAEIAKLPTKISVISVIFFVPIMLLIILAPVLISYLTN